MIALRAPASFLFGLLRFESWSVHAKIVFTILDGTDRRVEQCHFSECHLQDLNQRHQVLSWGTATQFLVASVCAADTIGTYLSTSHTC